jgi:hypothetical protein
MSCSMTSSCSFGVQPIVVLSDPSMIGHACGLAPSGLI